MIMLYIYSMKEKEKVKEYKKFEYSSPNKKAPKERVDALLVALETTKPLITIMEVTTLQLDLLYMDLTGTFKLIDQLFEVVKLD